VVATVPLVLGSEVEAAADAVRPLLALYIGGMGSRAVNSHRDVFIRLGFEADARRIHALSLDGRRAEAARAVPLQMVDQVALVGPRGRLREQAARWRQSRLAPLVVAGDLDTLELAAELFG